MKTEVTNLLLLTISAKGHPEGREVSHYVVVIDRLGTQLIVAYWRHVASWNLVITETMLIYCQLDRWKRSIKFESDCPICHSKKII